MEIKRNLRHSQLREDVVRELEQFSVEVLQTVWFMLEMGQTQPQK